MTSGRTPYRVNVVRLSRFTLLQLLSQVQQRLTSRQETGSHSMEVSMSVVIQALIGAAAGAFGAYVAIRSDLAELKAKVEHLHMTADKAHTRIDQILNK